MEVFDIPGPAGNSHSLEDYLCVRHPYLPHPSTFPSMHACEVTSVVPDSWQPYGLACQGPLSTLPLQGRSPAQPPKASTCNLDAFSGLWCPLCLCTSQAAYAREFTPPPPPWLVL